MDNEEIEESSKGPKSGIFTEKPKKKSHRRIQRKPKRSALPGKQHGHGGVHDLHTEILELIDEIKKKEIIFPGVNDQEEETEKSKKLKAFTQVEIINLLNKNMKSLKNEIIKNRGEINELRRDISSLSDISKIEEETALVFPRESMRRVFKYLFKNAIEFELIGGGALVFKKRDVEKVKYDLKDISIQERDIISSGELDYREVQRLREKYQK